MLRRYVVAGVAALVALGVTRLVWPLIEPTLSPLFLAAVVISAWYGGLGPGLFTTGVAVITKAFFFVAPRGSLRVDDMIGIIHLILFVVIACLISSLAWAQRRAETENARLIRRERAARADAEAANRAKDVFLATVSHELRAPLQAMSTWMHLLRRGGPDDPAFARALEGLARGLTAQTRLIDDLLDVSSIIAGKPHLVVTRVELGPLVEAAVATARAAAPPRDLALRVELDPATGPVLGDATRLEQVVRNLVSNALKFTPSGGRVDVRLQAAGDRARIIVADTGCGIPRELLGAVFEEFRQAERPDAGKRDGLGLGLAIVRRLVELHEGIVYAESDGTGRGATFVVELPVANAPPPRSGLRHAGHGTGAFGQSACGRSS